jgi:hypothetical protein
MVEEDSAERVDSEDDDDDVLFDDDNHRCRAALLIVERVSKTANFATWTGGCRFASSTRSR